MLTVVSLQLVSIRNSPKLQTKVACLPYFKGGGGDFIPLSKRLNKKRWTHYLKDLKNQSKKGSREIYMLRLDDKLRPAYLNIE